VLPLRLDELLELLRDVSLRQIRQRDLGLDTSLYKVEAGTKASQISSPSIDRGGPQGKKARKGKGGKNGGCKAVGTGREPRFTNWGARGS
jgi:hypothetical protein